MPAQQAVSVSFLGELSCKERSDEAGQFVGKRAGSAAAVAQKERSDDRSHGEGACGHHDAA